MVESLLALTREVPKCLYKGEPHADVDTCSELLCTGSGVLANVFRGSNSAAGITKLIQCPIPHTR